MNTQHVLGKEIVCFGVAQRLVLNRVLVRALKQASFEYTSVVLSSTILLFALRGLKKKKTVIKRLALISFPLLSYDTKVKGTEGADLLL